MIASIIGAILGWILRRFFPSQAMPSEGERAGRAEAELESERAAHEIEKRATAARHAVDDSLRGQVGPGSTTDPDAPINRNPHGHYRD